MPTPIVNVVRYSALVGGIGYGIFRQRSLQSQHDCQREHDLVAKKERWVAEAKEQWAKKHPSNSDVITDPSHPHFDLEKLLTSL